MLHSKVTVHEERRIAKALWQNIEECKVGKKNQDVTITATTKTTIKAVKVSEIAVAKFHLVKCLSFPEDNQSKRIYTI